MVLDLSSSPPVRLHHGEALEVLASLKTGAVEAVLTDPPTAPAIGGGPKAGKGLTLGRSTGGNPGTPGAWPGFPRP